MMTSRARGAPTWLECSKSTPDDLGACHASSARCPCGLLPCIGAHPDRHAANHSSNYALSSAHPSSHRTSGRSSCARPIRLLHIRPPTNANPPCRHAPSTHPPIHSPGHSYCGTICPLLSLWPWPGRWHGHSLAVPSWESRWVGWTCIRWMLPGRSHCRRIQEVCISPPSIPTS